MPFKLLSILFFSVVMSLAFRNESSKIAPNGVFKLPSAPLLGSGGYESDMMGTIGEVVTENNLRNKSVAIWGGNLATAHDLPFLYRVAADWFMLPEKPVPLVATAEEASKYEYILSPWDSAYDLKTDKFNVEQVVNRNSVSLYRLEKIVEVAE